MEDSYTVHRRRKAAARRREKTPDPPRRHQEDVASDEEEEARSRMERLVQETERLEELEESERRRVEADRSSGDHADPSVAEKLPRSLKRAMSPDVTRRIDDQTRDEDDPSESKVESVKAALPASVPPTSSSSTFDKTNSDNETRTVEKTKKVIDAHVQSRVAEQSKESVVKVTRKTVKKEDAAAADVTPTRVARRRTDVDKDLLSERVTEKPARSLKKALSPDPEKIEEKRTVGESRRRRRTSPSRDQEEERQAAALDKNRYEVSSATAAAAVTRESDAGAAKFVISERAEHVKKQDLDRDEDVHEKSRRPVEDSVMVKKRDVTTTTLPSKSRSSESRGASATKRSGKERNVERSGYTTDSSETEETDKRILKRTKSPEVAKTRSTSSRKTASGKSRANTDTDGDVGDVAEDLERRRKTERRRSANRRRGSSETDDEDIGLSRQRTRSPSHSVLERREAVPPVAARQGAEKSETVDDDFKMVRRSGTFPIDPPRDTSPSIVRSISETKKKQIIPLSDDILIEDFERAQREYLRKERGILDRDPLDDYVDPKMEAALRRRKFSIARTESEVERAEGEVKKSTPTKRSWWFGWRLPFFGRKVETEKVAETKIDEEAKILVKEEIPGPKKVSILEFFRTLADFLSEFRAFVEQNPRETRTIRILRNRCIAELLLAIIYCGLGAFVFRFTEGAFETFYKCGVKRVKRDFLDSLWNFSHNMREEDWKSMARRKLMEFEEQLHTAHEAGVHSYSGQKSWSFLNSVVYCLTVITTIGYGHISPSTTTGRAITIVYAIFGIPMFLIILADFGKLFTRGIKFLWAFVRRVYYTGSCRRVRRTVPVQEVMKGVQLVYDLATFRRPSQMNPEEIEEMQKQQNQTQTVLNLDGNASASIPGTPGTPAMSTFAIDDEFNLPISVAIIILLVYIFVGATVYNFWEQWGFFESFYFVFISMSTIGFGDYVPKHPMYMMLSIVYLVFGLALTSMCINVVQVMLSDSFKQASQKIGATIGFEVAEEDGSIQPAVPPPVELADVHATIKESESKEQVAPKAKQEDVEL